MIPDKVKIGGFEFTISESETVIIDDKASYAGKISYTEQAIQIKTGLAEDYKSQTFWHEVLHGIAWERNIDLGKNEEYIIDSMANGIYSFLKNNNYPLPGQK